MANENETGKRETVESIESIVAEMRYGTIRKHRTDHELLALYADRIEAAWRREKSEIEADALAVGGLVEAERRRVVVSKTETTTVGNAAAMRDAVVKALTLINVCDWPPGVSLDGVAEVIREIDSALAAPARQCDVGTPEEQERRYERFCDSHKWVDDEGANACLADCPLYNTSECALHWAQTPYAEEEGAGE
jgi:hypothetical protein